MRRHTALYSIFIIIVIAAAMVLINGITVSSGNNKNVYTLMDLEHYFKKNGIDLIREATNSLSINNQYGSQYSIKQSKNYEFEFYVYKSEQQVETARREFLYRTQKLGLEDYRLYRIKNVLAVLEGINNKDEIYRHIDLIIHKFNYRDSIRKLNLYMQNYGTLQP